MRTILWNVRGLGNLARRRQIREYITNEGVDCVGLQETKKADLQILNSGRYVFQIPFVGNGFLRKVFLEGL